MAAASSAIKQREIIRARGSKSSCIIYSDCDGKSLEGLTQEEGIV